jgi:hypothetical protein
MAEKDVEKGETPHGDGAVTVDLSAYLEKPEEKTHLQTFAIEEHNRNTLDNPDRESTNVVPVLVRRVNSEVRRFFYVCVQHNSRTDD